VQDTLTVLEALTGLMTRLAAANIDESDNRARLVSVYNALMHFQEDGDNIAFIDQRRRFYDTLIEIGGNRELKRIMPLMQVHLLRLQFQSYQSPRERARQFEEYQAVGEAVLSGDPKLAERTMRLRVRRTRNAVNKLPDTAFPAQA
jgi:DNA-binding GntR family transcriptional regulator